VISSGRSRSLAFERLSPRRNPNVSEKARGSRRPPSSVQDAAKWISEGICIMKLYVGNLSYSASEESSATSSRSTGRWNPSPSSRTATRAARRAFAFVEFANDQEAQAAISGLNGKEMSVARCP
jgi:RNA recognition motif-containing protein